MSEPKEVAGSTTAEIFISYSRRDAEAAESLRDRLIAAGLTAYLDKHDIAAGEDWRSRLGGLIEAADAIVFLISPDSIASEVCDWEVNHAELMGKRVIPVVCRDPADREVPARLRRLNYVFMRNPAEMESQLGRLKDALAVDIGWVRAHTRYGEQALEWDRAGRASRLLLRGAGIGEAERWRDGRPATAPELTETQAAYVAESRRAATRRQRGWIAGSSAVAVVSVALAIFAFLQQRAAEASRKETVEVQANSNFYQGSQLLESDRGSPDGVAFLSQAARRGDARAQTRLWMLLQQRSFWLPLGDAGPDPAPPAAAAEAEAFPEVRARFASVDVKGVQQAPAQIAVSGDGRRVFTAAGEPGEDVLVRVWNADATPVTEWFAPAYQGASYVAGARGFLSHDGRYVAVEVLPWRENALIQLYDLQERRQVGTPIPASGPTPQQQFMGFTTVAFIERPLNGEQRLLLLTGSSRGEAAVHDIDEHVLSIRTSNIHRASVAVVAVDPKGEWLMSAANDRSIVVSSLRDGRELGNFLRGEGREVTGLAHSADEELVVATDTGRRRFRLLAPTSRAEPGLPEDIDPSEPCLLATGAGGEDKQLAHPSGLTITLTEPRQVSVARAGGAAVSSPLFDADVAAVCASAAGDAITITTVDFRTDLWAADFSRRLGPAIDESRFFAAGQTPEKTDWVKFSPDGGKVMIRSSFWDPPNVEVFWLSLWDVANGQPLMDRARFEDQSNEGDIQSAAFDADASHILLLSGRKAVRALELATPTAAIDWLPRFTEAMTGLAVDADGRADRVLDRETILADGLARLQALNGE